VTGACGAWIAPFWERGVGWAYRARVKGSSEQPALFKRGGGMPRPYATSTIQKVRQRMSTQRIVFNDNYWGPPRDRLPELRLRTSTQTQASPLTYSHTIRRGEQTGQGFRYPVAMVVNPRTGLMYVANRSYEYRIELKRISICTVDEHFVGQFSTGGFGDGQIFWPRGLAIDQEDKVYLSDEWLQRISI